MTDTTELKAVGIEAANLATMTEDQGVLEDLDHFADGTVPCTRSVFNLVL